MTHNEFIHHVQEQAGLGSPEAAESATRATLQTLAQMLEHAGKLDDNLAAQLPAEMKEYLHPAQPFARLSPEEFFAQVAAQEGTNPTAAKSHAQTVVAVLTRAVGRDIILKVRNDLPPEYDPLFETAG